MLNDISSSRFEFPEKTIIILKTIEDYVNMAITQHQRILLDLEQIYKSYRSTLGLHGVYGQPIIVNAKALETVLFGDVHYYVICCDKIGKLMGYLNGLISVNHARLETYDILFDNFRKIRNSFEHIDERIGEEGIFEIGVFDGTFFKSYDGHQVDIINGEKYLKEFYSYLLEDLRKYSN